jgi:hypothetical protein
MTTEDAHGAGHKGREQYRDAEGEIPAMEEGADSLGTPAAGAGPAAHDPSGAHMPAGAAHHELHQRTPPGFVYAGESGELTSIEEGTELTEEGEAATGGKG